MLWGCPGSHGGVLGIVGASWVLWGGLGTVRTVLGTVGH